MLEYKKFRLGCLGKATHQYIGHKGEETKENFSMRVMIQGVVTTLVVSGCVVVVNIMY